MSHAILSSNYHDSDFWRAMYRQINSDKIWHGVIRNKRKDGSYFWADTIIVPLSLLTQFNGYIAIRSDVTTIYEQNSALRSEVDEKNGRLDNVESLLEKTDKMATLGFLVAGIAHEINNPMSYISSNMTILEKYVEQSVALFNDCLLCDVPDAKLSEIYAVAREQMIKNKLDILIQDAPALIEETNDGIARIRQIIQDLKLYSHAGNEKFASHNLNESIRQVIQIAHSEIKYRVEVSLMLEDIPEIECIENKLRQVLLNLIINAAQAIDGNGEISISTSLAGGDYVRIVIADTGSGIPAENLTNIFKPFFTTKAPGKGTGLGLSISADIIRFHNGTIDCSSELGRGTQFTIHLPIHQPVAESFA